MSIVNDTGTPMTLWTFAQYRFCLMFRMVARLRGMLELTALMCIKKIGWGGWI